MNLIEDPWIPAKNRSGDTKLIAPWEIVNGDYVGIDSERPDFKGGYILFLIGLFQTLNFIENEQHQFNLLQSPLSKEEVKAMLTPLTPFFNLDGNGPRFMQDLTLEKVDYTNISALAINYPGENTVKENKDFFVKRDEIKKVCPAAAAIALFTLQTMAPAGGSGHRTGLRRGGPLTSILSFTKNPFPDNSRANDTEPSLWQQIMINLIDQTRFKNLQGDHNLKDSKYKFPWLDKTWTSEPASKHFETQPLDCHPAQHYWGMPRRIRLDFENLTSGTCDLFGTEHTNLISDYYQTNYGVKYAGPWRHPLTPYRHEKEKTPLPFLVPKGGIGFRHWPGISINSYSETSKIQKALVLDSRLFLKRLSHVLKIQAFGYDMDKAKCCNWYETFVPLIALEKNEEKSFSIEVSTLIEAAEKVKSYLASAVKEAWFNPHKKVKKDFTFLEKTFWRETEEKFNQLSQKLLERIRENETPSLATLIPIREEWYNCIISVGMDLFEKWAMGAEAEVRDNERQYTALISFRKNIYGKKLREKILNLPKKSVLKEKDE